MFRLSDVHAHAPAVFIRYFKLILTDTHQCSPNPIIFQMSQRYCGSVLSDVIVMSVKRTRTWTYLTFYCSRQPYWTASTHSRHWTPWKHSSVNVIAHSQLLKWPALFISYQCNKHITLIKQQIISLTKHATFPLPSRWTKCERRLSSPENEQAECAIW